MERRTFIAGALGLATVLSSLVAEAAPSAQELLGAADRIRVPSNSFRLTNTLTEYENGAVKDRVVLTVFVRPNPTTGQYDTLARYAGPPRDVGKLVLFSGPNLWFYDPASKASIRISPQQRLLGQASNGDVVMANLAGDYAATLVGTETLQDADHASRSCLHLDLKSKTQRATYARVELWIEADTSRPVKGKFYADSGRLLKIAYYRAFRPVMGVVRPTETVIIDAINSQSVTTMITSDEVAQPVPESWFSRDFLPRIPLS